jgi:O-antigen ligase
MTTISKNKYLMMASNIHAGIRSKLQQSEYLTYSYIVFLAGFFISPDNHLHRNFFYLFFLAPFILYLDLGAIRRCFKTTLFKMSIIFLLYFLISMFWTKGGLTTESYYDHIRYFLMLVLFIMATMLISANSNRFLGRIIFWLCLVALISSVIFILYFYESHRFPKIRVRGPFDHTHNPNQAAMFFGFVAILAFYSMLCSKNKWQKIFYWTVFLGLSVFLLLSQSRGPLLALFLSMILGLALEKRWKEIIAIIAICAGLIFMIEIVGVGVKSMFRRGFGDRIDIWLASFERISQVPFLGEGYFTDMSIQTPKFLETSPHNLLLLVILKSGLVGGGFLTALVVAAVVKSYRYFVSSKNWIYLCIFAYFVLCMTFDSTHLLYKPTLGWLIFWMPVGLLAGEEIIGKNSKSIS